MELMYRLRAMRQIAAWDREATRGSERGATAVEYGLIVALIAAVIIATVVLVGQDVLGGFEDVEDNIGGSQN